MPFKSYRKASCTDWGFNDSTTPETGLSIEQIQLGAILRIADATEAMAKDYVKLQKDYSYMRERRDYYQQENERLKKSIIGLKGVIGRLKKKQQ